MTSLTNALFAFLLVCASTVAVAQRYNPDTGSIIWDLGPGDPRIDIKLGTKGVNIGGYEDVAPVITNNFSDQLLVQVEFRITDHCGATQIYKPLSKTLEGHQRWAPSPFFEGYGFDSKCDKFTEYGP